VPAVFFITHPDVAIEPSVRVPDWPLNERGRARMRSEAPARRSRPSVAWAAAMSDELEPMYSEIEPCVGAKSNRINLIRKSRQRAGT